MTTHVLDANALLAYLAGESRADTIETLFYDAEASRCQLYIHAINAYELYYQFYRHRSEDEANQFWTNLHRLPVTVLYTFNEDIVKMAGRMKATFTMSVADSFLLAQAILLSANVVTSDHHEFDVVDQANVISFYWFR